MPNNTPAATASAATPPTLSPPPIIDALLGSGGWQLASRVVLTLMFWTSGMAKLFDFEGNVAMMAGLGLHPAWLINSITLLLQIGASVMIIVNRGAWLACGALGIFTLLTIPIAHPFWAKTGDAAFMDMIVALEHLSVIGGLMVAAAFSRR